MFETRETTILFNGLITTAYQKTNNKQRHIVSAFHSNGEQSIEIADRNLKVKEHDWEFWVNENLTHDSFLFFYKVKEFNEFTYFIYAYCQPFEIYEICSDQCLTNVEKQAHGWIWQVLKLIYFLHTKKIAFRGICPNNTVLMSAQQKLKFVSKRNLVEVSGLPKNQQVQFTPHYLSPAYYNAPEGFMDPNKNSIEKILAFDIWSIGVMLYELIFGEVPFLNITKRSPYHQCTGFYTKHNFGIDEEIYCQNGWRLTNGCKNLLSRMLQTDPAKRITIQEILSHDWVKLGLSDRIDYSMWQDLESAGSPKDHQVMDAGLANLGNLDKFERFLGQKNNGYMDWLQNKDSEEPIGTPVFASNNYSGSKHYNLANNESDKRTNVNSDTNLSSRKCMNSPDVLFESMIEIEDISKIDNKRNTSIDGLDDTDLFAGISNSSPKFGLKNNTLEKKTRDFGTGTMDMPSEDFSGRRQRPLEIQTKNILPTQQENSQATGPTGFLAKIMRLFGCS